MRREFYIRISVFVCIVLGLAVAGGIRLSGQTAGAEANRFQPGAGVHQTRTESLNSLQFPKQTELAQETEPASSPPPTRSSFMATWLRASSPKRYLLDVSTSSSFTSYVEGYHDLDVGSGTGRAVTDLTRGTTYYYRVRAYDATGVSGYSQTMAVTTQSTTGLTIHATFDSSITQYPNAAAIQAMINRAIAFYESLFSDPITVQIRFRYATTGPNGTPLPSGRISQSNFVVYTGIPWSTFITALRANATTNNDNLANASLPGSAPSPHIVPSSADGRAVGLNTPPAMFANGSVGVGGPYDGILTLNSAAPFQFTRPISSNHLDAQWAIEHEIDEVLGLGSHLGTSLTDLRPQDL